MAIEVVRRAAGSRFAGSLSAFPREEMREGKKG
jgi:hypothetical protein